MKLPCCCWLNDGQPVLLVELQVAQAKIYQAGRIVDLNSSGISRLRYTAPSVNTEPVDDVDPPVTALRGDRLLIAALRSSPTAAHIAAKELGLPPEVADELVRELMASATDATDALADQVFALWRKGMAIKSIAEHLGQPLGVIAYCLKTARFVALRHNPRPESPRRGSTRPEVARHDAGPRGTAISAAHVAKNQATIERRQRQVQQAEGRQRCAQINRQIDQLLTEVWSRQGQTVT